MSSVIDFRISSVWTEAQPYGLLHLVLKSLTAAVQEQNEDSIGWIPVSSPQTLPWISQSWCEIQSLGVQDVGFGGFRMSVSFSYGPWWCISLIWCATWRGNSLISDFSDPGPAAWPNPDEESDQQVVRRGAAGPLWLRGWRWRGRTSLSSMEVKGQGQALGCSFWPLTTASGESLASLTHTCTWWIAPLVSPTTCFTQGLPRLECTTLARWGSSRRSTVGLTKTVEVLKVNTD